MPKVIINKDKCKGCMLCIYACPKKLIKKSKNLNKMGISYMEFSQGDKENVCTGCGLCTVVCPECCIQVCK